MARKSLIAFTEYTYPEFEASEHHHQIADALESVERGEIDRLIITAPPRHTKSELASRRFPAWYLGRHPNRQIICSTYSGDFALDFGREVRNIVSGAEYQNLFDTRLAEDSKAANRWHTSEGGIYVSVGIGGPITGRGAHVALIDDSLKNREEADSEVRRETVWNWYSSTLRTRLMPGGAIVLILTRWHDDDLAGRLLEKQPGKWTVIDLKAITTVKGEEKALWPSWYPLEALYDIKSEIVPRDWSALYQQSPQPDEGTFFKREWFNRYHLKDKPARLNNYGASDYAVTDGDGDYTEHGIGGFDEKDNLYLQHWWSGQTTADVWIDTQLDIAESFKPYVWVAEGGVIRRSVEPFIKRRMRDRHAYCRLEWITSNKDKPANARAFQALASMGKVFIPYTEWGEALIDQLLRFPAGTRDDKVDVCGLFGRILDQTYKPSAITVEKKKPSDPYGFDDDDGDNWKTA